MTSKAPVTFADLPVELVIEILKHIDNNDTLIQLSHTCKLVNDIALNAFFTRNQIRSPAQGWLVGYMTPPHTLHAVRCALSVKRLPQVHYYFNPDLKRLRAEVWDMHQLLTRMPSLRRVKFHLTVVDTWISNLSRPGKTELRLPADLWKEEFAGLLDLILDKGCEELGVLGGQKFGDLYHFNQDWTPWRVQLPDTNHGRSKFTLSHKLVNFLRRLFCLHAEPPSPPPLRHRHPNEGIPGSLLATLRIGAFPLSACKLNAFNIHSNMLLEPPFLDWTISRLFYSSTTITMLSIRGCDISCANWKYFFSNISLPILDDFSIDILSISDLHFDDVSEFLKRHDTITALHLFNCGAPPKSVIYFPSLPRRPFLPRLASVKANAQIVIWLLGNNLAWFTRSVSSRLSSVTISTEHRASESRFDYKVLDLALHHVLTFALLRSKRKKEKPLSSFVGTTTPFTLSLQFVQSSGIDQWLSNHISLGASSPLAQLSSAVTTLEIYGFYDRFSRTTVALFPAFFALFLAGGEKAKLECVRFAEPTEEARRMLEDAEWVEGLARCCGRLKSLVVQGKRFELEEFRARGRGRCVGGGPGAG